MSLVAARGRRIQSWKLEVVRELRDLFTKYRSVLIADLTSTPTNVVQKIRKELRRYGETRVAKKNLILKAVESLGQDKSELENHLRGTILLIFSNENPFKLYSLVESLKVPVDAKPGQIAPKDIVIPEGPTNIPAGPMLGLLGRLKIPYEVRGGKAYIKKSTVVVKAGQPITPEVASILQKVGVKPIEVSLNIIAAYDGGVVIPSSSLKLDIEAFTRDLTEALQESIKIAVEALVLDVPEALPYILISSERRAEALAGELALPLPGLLETALRKASAEGMAIVAALGDRARELGIEEAGVAPAQPQQTTQQPIASTEKKHEEEEEEKKEEEVDLASGLSGLFGF